MFFFLFSWNLVGWCIMVRRFSFIHLSDLDLDTGQEVKVKLANLADFVINIMFQLYFVPYVWWICLFFDDYHILGHIKNEILFTKWELTKNSPLYGLLNKNVAILRFGGKKGICWPFLWPTHWFLCRTDSGRGTNFNEMVINAKKEHLVKIENHCTKKIRLRYLFWM